MGTIYRNDVAGPIDSLASAEPKVAAVGRGEQLEPATRAFFEPRLGFDFSRVRVHADGAADAAASAVGALAYTRGPDIVFRRGTYAPGTPEGRRLIAHELAHVVQQREAEPLRPGGITGPAPSSGAGRDVIRRAVDEDGKETPAAPPTSASVSPITSERAAEIGREALETMGYAEIMRRALAAGLLKPANAPESAAGSGAPDAGVIQRQSFGEVFSRYAVAAGVASQVDSPAPGPGDVVAVGILVVGLFAAIAASRSRPAPRVCPPCPAPPPPEVDKVPPSAPHFPCPGDHWHYYVYNQNPVTCQCYGPRRMFGGCCGLGTPGAPC